MRGLAPTTLVAALLAALLAGSAAQAQEPRNNAFRWCLERADTVPYPTSDTTRQDPRGWAVWDMCLDQVTYMSR